MRQSPRRNRGIWAEVVVLIQSVCGFAEDTVSYSRSKDWGQKALGGGRQGHKAAARMPKDGLSRA